jgi:hypothetical protein
MTKKIIYLSVFAVALQLLISCAGENETSSNDEATNTSVVGDTDDYDPKRGEGKFSAENMNISSTLDVDMATKGEAISGTKCTSCHKLSNEKLVGPGWAGVTERRELHWIMNFITNPDPMIEKDPEIQAQLELCLVRMPNQNLSDDEARSIIEFMRKNDGVK